MTKFHVNSDGVPGKCAARNGNCPFGGDSDHYDSFRDAQVAAEQKLENEFGLFSVKGTKPEHVNERAKLSSRENEGIDTHRAFIREKGKRSYAAYSLAQNSSLFIKKMEWMENVSRHDLQDVQFDEGSLSTGYYTVKGDDTKHRFDVSGLPEEPERDYQKKQYFELSDADRGKYEFYAHVEEGNITPKMYEQTIREDLNHMGNRYSRLYFRVNAPSGDGEAPYNSNASDEYRKEQTSKELRGLFASEEVSPSRIESVEFDHNEIIIDTEAGDTLIGEIDEYPYLANHFISRSAR